MNLDKLPRYWKTVMAVLTGIAVVGTEVVSAAANEDWDHMTKPNVILRMGMLIIGAYAVYKKRNVLPVGAVPNPTVSEAEVDPK